MQPLIGDGSLWLWCVMFAVAALSFAVERTRFGKVVSGAMVALGLSLVLANVGVIPSAAASYDTVGSYLVTTAIPLLLFQADLRRVVRESGATLYCFLIGTATVVLGVFVAFWLVPLAHELAAKLAGVYAATYIGGTMNFVAVSQAVGLGGGDFAAGLAADNIVTTTYLMSLGLLPAVAIFRRMFARFGVQSDESAPAATAEPAQSLELPALTFAMALAFAIAALGAYVGQITAVKYAPVLVTTFVATLIATMVPAIGRLTRGAFQVGMIFMYVFFVTVGAGADIAALIDSGAGIFAFAVIVVATHLLVMMPIVASLGLPMREAIVGSCSTVSGPSVSAALAASRGWHDLVTPGVLTGVLGYVIANVIGIAITRALS
jgi:uncharacterized membrane protein